MVNQNESGKKLPLFIIHFDGACDGRNVGNTQNVAVGVQITHQGKLVLEYCGNLGLGTNNDAEWAAAYISVKLANTLITPCIVRIVGDSQYVVYSMLGIYKSKKHANIKAKIDRLLKTISVPVTFSWVKRDKNQMADALSKRGLLCSKRKAEITYHCPEYFTSTF